jgi:acyl transferase domain-containing protein/thioesterase domain-containing protein/acyl carrier protein
MGAGLYASEPIFRRCLDSCAQHLISHLGLDLRENLYPSAKNSSSCANLLNCTRMTQPALFAIEYSLAQWWMALGIRPQALLGHSIGEYVAACVAGVLSLEDALAITAVRGRLMEECPPGAMLAVSLSQEEVSLPEGISIAAVNAPNQCVLSGPSDRIAELEHRLGEQSVICRRLQTSRAFHSSMMEPILERFLLEVQQVSLRPPQIPYLSNLTGTWIKAAEATDPEYWVKHLRNTVRFSDCSLELLREPGRVMIEVGPGHTLASLVKQHVGLDSESDSARVFSSLRRPEQAVADTTFLLNTLGQLWVEGQAVNWFGLHDAETVMRIPLPTYPFQRQRYWVEPDTQPLAQPERPLPRFDGPNTRPAVESTAKMDHAAEKEIDQWFYERRWHRTIRPIAASLAPTRWLVFQDSMGLGKQITLQLRGAAHEVFEVFPGDAFRRTARGQYTIRAGTRTDYDALLTDLNKRKLAPTKIVHLWAVREGSSRPSPDDQINLNFYSPLFLAQALGEQDMSEVDIAVVSDRLHSIAGEPAFDPISATLLGPIRVIPKEYPGIICRSIDVDTTSEGAVQLAVQIIAEHCAKFGDPVVAIRRGERWTESLEPCELHASPGQSRLKQRGVYLITGGLGDLGLVIAEELARQFRARLVLLGRSTFPVASKWKNALEATETPARVKQQIKKLNEIESLGAEVLQLTCDVCRHDEVKKAIEIARARFGSINGVIHAAGVIEDSPFQTKSRESAARVLNAKVHGTLTLHEVLDAVNERTRVDFFALFSSVSSIQAPAGQVDYVAANAFLDAFAASRRDPDVIAINWGAWRDVGMAARTSPAHPLLGRRLVNTGDEVAYAVPLSYERHWLLAEHCTAAGRTVFPGTGYLEMAAAALTRGVFDQGVEFEDVFFLAPLLADPGQTRDARLELRRGRNGAFRFSVQARDADWIEHASGQVARSNQARPANHRLDRILARCQTDVLTFDDAHRTKQEKFFHFGPRWRCLKAIHLGENEALAELELPGTYAEDTSSYHLHPALLDLATGSALYLIDDYRQSDSLYFPMSYKRAVIYRRLPSKFSSHIRSRRRNEARHDVATFDLTLLDERGKVLGEIEGFSMRLVRDPESALTMPGQVRQNDLVESSTQRGIAPAEGAKAFTRILSSEPRPGIFVLPDGPWTETRHQEMVERPTISEVSSKDSVESVLTEWWQEMLGVERVRLDDNFFELGGQSLIVVRLFNKIKKTYGVNFGLSTLFEARTVRKLARLIEEARANPQSERPSGRALVAIQPKGTNLPLFVISGLGGNVIKFHTMAFYLGEHQPVYGLLPRGLDGRESYHTRVEDMAAYYVEAIREVQANGPYRLVGYSFGGAVALEVAQQLTAKGSVVSLLGMFDTIEWSYMEQVEKSLGFRERFAVYLSQLKLALHDGDTLRLLWKRIESKRARIMARVLPALGRPTPPLPDGTIENVNAYAGANYRPKVYPGTLTLFRSTNRGPLDGDDEFLGWGGLVSGGIEVLHIPSTHSNILQEPGVRILSARLRGCLDRDAAPITTELQVALA